MHNRKNLVKKWKKTEEAERSSQDTTPVCVKAIRELAQFNLVVSYHINLASYLASYHIVSYESLSLLKKAFLFFLKVTVSKSGGISKWVGWTYAWLLRD